MIKNGRQGNPCSGANKTLSSLLTAVLKKISSEECCMRPSADLCQVSKPQKLLEEYQTLERVGSGIET